MAEVEWLILADSAEVLGNKLFLMGGGWDTLTPPSFPTVHNFAVAAAIRASWEEVEQGGKQDIELVVAPRGGARQTLITAGALLAATATMRRGEPQRAQFAVRISLSFDKPGVHDLILRLNGEDARSVTFYVNSPTSGEASTQAVTIAAKPVRRRAPKVRR